MRFKLLVILLSIFSLVGVVYAQHQQLVAYKDAEGNLTEQSKVNFKAMRRIAGSEGSITVWVDFNIPFEPNPELRTPEVIAQEARYRRRAINAVVSPLEASGDAKELEIPEWATMVPGCMVETTAKGLSSIARHSVVKHIGYKPKDD